MQTVLIVVPCGQRKIWDKHPRHGPARAEDAYTGAPFKLNRVYAERFGDVWIVLSAKYGFIAPDFQIPEPYDVAFTKPKTSPIAVGALQQQVEDQQLHRYSVIVGLGGAAYRNAIAEAFAPFPVRLAYPFAGLPIGKMMQATKRATTTGNPGFVREESS